MSDVEQQLSENLFGSKFMLRVMAEIARSVDDEFSSAEVARWCQADRVPVHRVTNRLVVAGLLKRKPVATGGVVPLERQPSVLWDAARECLENLRGSGS